MVRGGPTLLPEVCVARLREGHRLPFERPHEPRQKSFSSNVSGGGIVELGHEWQNRIATLDASKSFQHGSPGNEESSDSTESTVALSSRSGDVFFLDTKVFFWDTEGFLWDTSPINCNTVFDIEESQKQRGWVFSMVGGPEAAAKAAAKASSRET